MQLNKLFSIDTNECILSRLTVISVLALMMPGIALASNLRLHYDKPAKYFEEALPIGNGKLGALVYGGETCDSISLNDITLWSGMPDTVTYLRTGMPRITLSRFIMNPYPTPSSIITPWQEEFISAL